MIFLLQHGGQLEIVVHFQPSRTRVSDFDVRRGPYDLFLHLFVFRRQLLKPFFTSVFQAPDSVIVGLLKFHT